MTILRTGLPPDLTATEIISSQSITTADVTSSSIDCWGYSHVNVWVNKTANVSATKLKVTFQWSDDNISWDPQHTEVISGGVATISDYLVELPVGAGAEKLHASIETYGRRYCRIVVATDTSSLTASVALSRG